MDKNKIGKNAGVVWNLLAGGDHCEYAELKARSGLSDRDLNAAIGWLAREDKICFELDKETGKEYVFVSLNLYY